ncbi:hypothetical protein BpHYR1_022263, partial [Brachionus plicatilis]
KKITIFYVKYGEFKSSIKTKGYIDLDSSPEELVIDIKQFKIFPNHSQNSTRSAGRVADISAPF